MKMLTKATSLYSKGKGEHENFSQQESAFVFRNRRGRVWHPFDFAGTKTLSMR